MQQRGQDDRNEPYNPGEDAPYAPTRSRSGEQPQYGPPPQFGVPNPYAGQAPYVTGTQPYPMAPAPKKTGQRVFLFGCLPVVALGVILAIAAVVVGSKPTTTVATTAGNTAKATAAATGAAAASAAAPAGGAKVAGLGDTINVTDESGDKLAVTLMKADPRAASTDGFSSPDAGDQYYAAQFQIKDVGSAAWSDAPSNCTVVKDGKGQTFDSTIVESVSSGPLMADTANLGAGDSTLGWIVFQVPKGDVVTTVQFTPLSGMADDTAQWSLS